MARSIRSKLQPLCTTMHEIAHAMGIGQSVNYTALFSGGVYTGITATALLRQIESDDTAEIHGDTQHFGPYGLNYEFEYGNESELVNYCKIVSAILFDMGWL